MGAGPLIRRATGADLADLIALRRAFWESQVRAGLADSPDLSEARLLQDTEGLLSRPRTVLLLAMGEEAPCGYALAALQIVPGQAQSRVALVEELFVRPGTVRRGLGTALAEQALAELPSGAAARQQIRVLACNAVGRAFWQRLGFRDAVVTMERRAEEEP